MTTPETVAHLPGPVPIDSYGNGGFRFAGMSHRGSLLCLPSGMWGWEVTAPAGLTVESLARVFAEADAIDLLLVGQGRDLAPIGEPLRWRLRDRRIAVELMSTGQALRTWNVLLAEGRRVAATLIAVD